MGIAVKSIEEALPYYEQVLGFECYNIETVEEQKVRTAFLKVGETKIELLEATSPTRSRTVSPMHLPSARRRRYAQSTRHHATAPRD